MAARKKTAAKSSKSKGEKLAEEAGAAMAEHVAEDPNAWATVRLAKQEYEIRRVDSLRPHEANANQGNRAVIGESMEANGFYGAVLVQKSSDRILAGHHRLDEAKAKGLVSVPCIVIDCSDEEADRILGVDNRSTRLGVDDPEKLHALLERYRKTSEGLKGSGYGEKDYLKLATKLTPPEKIPVFRDTVKEVKECPNCGHQWSTT